MRHAVELRRPVRGRERPHDARTECHAQALTSPPGSHPPPRHHPTGGSAKAVRRPRLGRARAGVRGTPPVGVPRAEHPPARRRRRRVPGPRRAGYAVPGRVGRGCGACGRPASRAPGKQRSRGGGGPRPAALRRAEVRLVGVPCAGCTAVRRRWRRARSGGGAGACGRPVSRAPVGSGPVGEVCRAGVDRVGPGACGPCGLSVFRAPSVRRSGGGRWGCRAGSGYGGGPHGGARRVGSGRGRRGCGGGRRAGT